MNLKLLNSTGRAAVVALLVTLSLTAAWAQRLPISRTLTATFRGGSQGL